MTKIFSLSLTRSEKPKLELSLPDSQTKKKGDFMKIKKLKKLPIFKSENEEREFWATHSSVDYIDWSQAVHAKFPNLRLTSKPITLRLPLSLLDDLKVRANSLDVPYQSLMKIYLKQGLDKQLSQPI
jgi:predicted DNA binding CopG/RHH family protein